MRKGSLATAIIAVLAVSACKGKDQTMNADLAKDVATAANSDGLELAPSHGLQTVVSAEERSPEAKLKMAPSARSTRATPHRTPHRDRVAAHHAAEVASVAAPAPEAAPALAPAPAATSATDPAPAPTESAPVAVVPRPHPVDVGSAPGSGSGGMDAGRGGIGGSGISIGDVIGGVIGAVVIRGGAVDGDHCDPRGRRSGGSGILVNNRGGSILRGRF